jgi:hypothetical protein
VVMELMIDVGVGVISARPAWSCASNIKISAMKSIYFETNSRRRAVVQYMPTYGAGGR